MTAEEAYRLLQVDLDTRAVLERFNFDLPTFLALQDDLREGRRGIAQNRLTTALEPPQPDDVLVLPPLSSDERGWLERRGQESLAQGEVAVVVLAGGMATRFGGVAKACAQALDGMTFLELKLADLRRVARISGARVPLHVMTSFATDDAVRSLIAHVDESVVPVSTFAQFVSLRLTREGELFRDLHGQPSLYAPGHGDLVPALQRAGLLGGFLSQGVKYIVLSNIDNLAATLDPAILGMHIVSDAGLSFEVVQSRAGDVGGVPARVAGRLQVIEGMRQPAEFNAARIPLFSTNCFIFRVQELAAGFALEWFVAEKELDGRPVVQFERLVNQLTAFIPSRAIQVARDGQDARFLPIKDRADLVAARPRLEQLLAARGVIQGTQSDRSPA